MPAPTGNQNAQHWTEPLKMARVPAAWNVRQVDAERKALRDLVNRLQAELTAAEEDAAAKGKTVNSRWHVPKRWIAELAALTEPDQTTDSNS